MAERFAVDGGDVEALDVVDVIEALVGGGTMDIGDFDQQLAEGVGRFAVADAVDGEVDAVAVPERAGDSCVARRRCR